MWCFSEWPAYKLAVFLILHLFHIRWFCFHNNSHLIQENVKLSFGQMLKGSIYLFGCAHAWGGGCVLSPGNLERRRSRESRKGSCMKSFSVPEFGPSPGSAWAVSVTLGEHWRKGMHTPRKPITWNLRAASAFMVQGRSEK